MSRDDAAGILIFGCMLFAAVLIIAFAAFVYGYVWHLWVDAYDAGWAKR